MDQLDRGHVKLPDGVTTSTLEPYARLAQDAIDGLRDKLGVGPFACKPSGVSRSSTVLHLLRDDLIPRDADMLAPAESDELHRLGDAFGITIDPFFTRLYAAFDGHAVPDENMITLWSPQRIIADQDAVTIDSRRYDAIGDVMIDSDFIVACLKDAGAPVYLRLAGDRIAASAVDLVGAIFTGRLAL